MSEWAIYRLFSNSGELLYVGISMSPQTRIYQHSRKPWYSQMDRSRTVVGPWFPDKAAARLAEATAIVAENPLHNRDRTAPEIVGQDESRRQIFISKRNQAAWNQAKLAAKAEGVSISQYVTSALDDYLRNRRRKLAAQNRGDQ